LQTGCPTFHLSSLKRQHHRSDKNPLHQCQQVTGRWLLGIAIALRVCCLGGAIAKLSPLASLSTGDWVLAAWNGD
jgi:hypothetical protein